MEKKKKLKELFNQQFDNKEERSYHDDLKMEADVQGEVSLCALFCILVHCIAYSKVYH